MTDIYCVCHFSSYDFAEFLVKGRSKRCYILLQLGAKMSSIMLKIKAGNGLLTFTCWK